MTAANPAKSILIVSNSADELRSVHELMTNDLGGYWSANDEAAGLRLFQENHPPVLVLAFETIEHAERFYLTLYRQCPNMQDIPHQTVLLCKITEAEAAYKACVDGTFSDYVVNRPLHDPFRLRLSLRHAIDRRDVHQHSAGVTRQLADAGGDLRQIDHYIDRQMAAGGPQQQESLRALQGLTTRLAEQIRQVEARLGSPAFGNVVKVVEQGKLRAEPAAPRPALTPAPFAAPAAAPARPREILIVDDDEVYREVLASIIEEGGYVVASVESGEAALASLATHQPDVVLLDYNMPGLNGAETLRRIKADAVTQRLPVIILTGAVDKSIFDETRQAGAAGFIIKPSNRPTILGKVQSVLGETTL